jgi:translation initiation factor IF-2
MAAAVKQLMVMGVMVTVNETLDVDIAKRLAAELGASVEEAPKIEAEAKPDKPEPEERAGKFLRQRPPVVTVMGHVDHGKTTLLDTIRKSRVAAQEAGGITQHIGASVVNWRGNRVVFIDTPGHEAFTAMRARGAQVTDLVILVVAADDGVKPQTVEAISHIRAAKVPMIVAINKIDRPGADPDRVKRQLSELGVSPEDWGGDTVFVNVSALQGTGIDPLLEMVMLVSEMQELKANPLAPGKGTVVEAQLDRSRGPVATVLIQTGTLRLGDAVVAGTASGRVRALFDFSGRRVDHAGPSVPVEVLGLSEVPTAGDQFEVVEDDKVARERAARALEERKTDQAVRPTVSLDDLYTKLKEGRTKDLNLVLKADVQGSLEALKSALSALQLPEVRLTVVHGGVGPISESDVMLASTSDAIVIGFNARPDPNARRIAQRERVQIREYEIIYSVLDDITAAAKGLLEPKMETVLIGKAQVRATFKVPRVGTIAGCYVLEGKITRNAAIKVTRDGRVVHEGALDSLKRFKDDVREVQAGYECGLGVAGFEDYVEGDIIEAYITQRQETEP